MGKPTSNRKLVTLPPIHEVAKIIPSAEYWTRRNVLVGSFGMSTTTYVQCACGMKFRNTEFEKHLLNHGFTPKHFLKATLHHRGEVIYSCDCGRTFKTVEDIAAHVNVSKLETVASLPTPASRLSLALTSAFSAVGHITDDLASALGWDEKTFPKIKHTNHFKTRKD